MNMIYKSLKTGLQHVYLAAHDTVSNHRYATAPKRFLVVRHGGKGPRFYNVILDWVAKTLPDLRTLFELHQLPCRVRDFSPYLLHIPWLQDPVQQWSAKAYQQANALAEKCDEHQIPVVNRVDQLMNAAKSTGARLIASTGIRTPQAVLITDADDFKETMCGMKLPLLVREDWGHGGLVCRADTPSDVRDMQLERFSRPVAMEFIDVQDSHDGLYRKYRYVAAGDEGVSHTLHTCKEWRAGGSLTEYNEALRDEEVSYISHADPNHERLQRARKALGLDFVAFDYSYDRDGQLLVWEANPYPYIHFAKGRRTYRAPAIDRTMAAIIKLYLNRAGLPIPKTIDDLLQY